MDTEEVRLREAIREAHGVLKDLERVRAEARREIDAYTVQAIHDRLNTAVEEGLASYRDAVSTAIDEAVSTVFKRFDTVASALLGETSRDRRAGRLSISEQVSLRELLERYTRSTPPIGGAT